MKQVKQFLTIFVALALLLLIYELLLTPNIPTISSQKYQHVGSSQETNTLSRRTGALKGIDMSQRRDDPGSRSLRQLLQDEEITQLPVKIFTDCPSDHSIYVDKKIRMIQDPNIVCLNETKLYRDSYAQYGVAFSDLTVLQQKASIVRAVLFDLEKRQGTILKQFDFHQNLSQALPGIAQHSNQDGDDEAYDYDQDDQNSDTEELNREIEAVHLLATRNVVTNQSLNSAPRVVYFPRGHPPPSQVHKAKPRPSLRPAKKEEKMPRFMNPDLIKLKGVKVIQTYDLNKRGFSSEWKVDSPSVNDRLKFVTMAINGTDPSERSVTSSSLNPDLLKRAKFQQERMGLFCQQHTHPPATLPLENTELDTLFQHLLYDDEHKIVFCYVPKNGCSNMKRMMLVLNGILPPDASHQRRPEESVLKQVHSFRNLTHEQALYRLQNYFKLAIVRNPLERLLSAYKNKLEGPFNVELRKHFPERLKAFILKSYRREEFEKWIARNVSTEDIHPSFEEFVQFMNSYPLTAYNEHFKPFLELCSPCAVNFDLFLSFKTLEYDIYALMEYLNIPLSLYPKAIAHHTKPISEYMTEYYSGISKPRKDTLFRRFSREFDFYFSLHPEEWSTNSHL